MIKRFVIVDKDKNNYNFSHILAYSEGNKLNDGSVGDGYFWTSMRYFIKCYLDAPDDKELIFWSKKEAKCFAKSIDLQCPYRIVKLQFRLL